MDGPDGWKYYWHDLTKNKEILSKHQLGEGSVMTWRCFAYNGVGSVALVSKKWITSIPTCARKSSFTKYWISHWRKLKISAQKYKDEPAHTSKRDKHWFLFNNVVTLKRPAKFTNLLNRELMGWLNNKSLWKWKAFYIISRIEIYYRR